METDETFVVDAIESALLSPSLPSEILNQLLNLAGFMELQDKASFIFGGLFFAFYFIFQVLFCFCFKFSFLGNKMFYLSRTSVISVDFYNTLGNCFKQTVLVDIVCFFSRMIWTVFFQSVVRT